MTKALKKNPWTKWYHRDWRSEPRLKLCSRAARSAWMDMLGLMDEATPRGFLLVEGISPDMEQLARLLGDPEKDVRKWIGDLERCGVFSRAGADNLPDDIVPLVPEGVPVGTIFSRRMVRDIAKDAGNREAGFLGGNPLLARGTVPKSERVRPYKRTDSPAKTKRIFDRTGGKCHWCGVELLWTWDGEGEMPTNLFHVDHVIAVRDGGTNDEANLVPACAFCNHKRAKKEAPTLRSERSKRRRGRGKAVGVGDGVGDGSDDKAQRPETRKSTPLEPPRAGAEPGAIARASGNGGSSPSPRTSEAGPKTRGQERNGADRRSAGKDWYNGELARLRRTFGDDANLLQSECGGPVPFVKSFKEAMFDRAGGRVIAPNHQAMTRLLHVMRIIKAVLGDACRIVLEPAS